MAVAEVTMATRRRGTIRDNIAILKRQIEISVLVLAVAATLSTRRIFGCYHYRQMLYSHRAVPCRGGGVATSVKISGVYPDTLAAA